MKQYYVFSLPKDQPIPQNTTRFIAVKVKDIKKATKIRVDTATATAIVQNKSVFITEDEE